MHQLRSIYAVMSEDRKEHPIIGGMLTPELARRVVTDHNRVLWEQRGMPHTPTPKKKPHLRSVESDAEHEEEG